MVHAQTLAPGAKGEHQVKGCDSIVGTHTVSTACLGGPLGVAVVMAVAYCRFRVALPR
jgi:hypothetical protein